MAKKPAATTDDVLSLSSISQRSNPVAELEKLDDETLDALFDTGIEGLKAYGQLKQDLMALVLSGCKRDGYFVEFGATNGVKLSNSFMLERDYEWKGIVAEPAVDWHPRLSRDRTCIIDFRCVWKATGETLEFDMVKNKTLSTIAEFSASDMHARSREDSRRIQVKTVTLDDMLEEHGAPEYIDYLSIDTEGSEFDILNAVDFSKHTFGFITVEHNFTDYRKDIYDLLTKNGFRRIFERLSQFDDWYVYEGT